MHVKKYPWLFVENTAWDKYPFLLPNLVVVIFLLGSSVIGLFFLEELHPKFRRSSDLVVLVVNAARDVLCGRSWNFYGAGYTAVETEEASIELAQVSLIAVEMEPNKQEKSLPSAWSRQVMLQIGFQCYPWISSRLQHWP